MALFWTSMLSLAVAIVSVSPAGQGATSSQQLVRPAVAALVESFRDYRLVAIGEAHRDEQLHDFIVTLLRDPRFLPDGGDIVVEFGNARYQGVMDRYVSGEAIARDDLTRVWRDTVNILVWDAPVYERLFSTVRSINQHRPPSSRLRVVLADPPIDWNTIHERAAWEQTAATRDRHAANVTEREVLARGRRALLIFGSGHVCNEKAFDRYGKPNRIRSPNLAELLEAEHPHETLFVLADNMGIEFGSQAAEWQPPVLARLRGTWLGDVHVGPPQGTPRLSDLADEFLYLGPTALMTISAPASEIYKDAAYMRELLRRNKIQGGANTTELQRLATSAR